MDMAAVAKITGFLGDGITFIGSIFLAMDALFKRRVEATLSKRRLVADDYPDSAETRDGQPMTARSIEDRATAKSVHYAWIGALLLALGFACLFVSRWCEAGV